jgi:hypothetical protein
MGNKFHQKIYASMRTNLYKYITMNLRCGIVNVRFNNKQRVANHLFKLKFILTLKSHSIHNTHIEWQSPISNESNDLAVPHLPN